jgi:RNA polymerase sigma-70 factor, ECF subfamily
MSVFPIHLAVPYHGRASYQPARMRQSGPTPMPAPVGPAPGVSADRALVASALAGDPASGEEFVRRMSCAAQFLGMQNRRYGSPFSSEDLGDLAQDVVAVVWDKLASYEGRGPLEAWVCRICALEYMNALRRRARRRTSQVDALPEEPAQPVAIGTYDRSDLAPLRKALVELTQVEQQVLRLRHYEQSTFPEIAVALALPLNTVKSHYHRALLRLRERLRHSYAEEEKK